MEACHSDVIGMRLSSQAVAGARLQARWIDVAKLPMEEITEGSSSNSAAAQKSIQGVDAEFLTKITPF